MPLEKSDIKMFGKLGITTEIRSLEEIRNLTIPRIPVDLVQKVQEVRDQLLINIEEDFHGFSRIEFV